MESPKGMLIGGVAASQCVDKAGERISIEGIDISILEAGEGLVNVEHADQGKDGAYGQEIVGKIVYAKKVLKESDATTDLQKEYWKKIELPFLFIIARLYDAAGHEAAKAIAAQIRDHASNGEKILTRFSIEGSTIDQEDGLLKETIARKVSLTLKPCNATCDVALLQDNQAPEGFKKDVKVDELKVLKAEDPTKQILSFYESDLDPVIKSEELEDPTNINILDVLANVQFLKKALEAGQSGSAPPGELSQGASLQAESIDKPKKPKKKRAAVDLAKLKAPESLQKLYCSLQKAEIDGLSYLAKSAPETHYWARNPMLVAGKILIGNEIASIIYEDAQFYYCVPDGKLASYEFADLYKVNKNRKDCFRVLSRPYSMLAP